MSAWRALEEELDRWRDTGRTASLWWRDDDAVGHTPALERLLRLAGDHSAPVALAVIPATAQESLAEALTAAPAAGGHRGISVLLHGYAHKNHAGQGEKKSEYVSARPVEDVDREISAGFKRLKDLFDDLVEPVFVPPWNRIAPAVVSALPRLGLTGLSTFGPRQTRHPAPGLVEANSHVDPVDWHGSRSYLGDDIVLGAAIGHLRARRTRPCDAEEPTGLLTHHLTHDEALWSFTSRFAATISRHPAARLLTASEVFRAGPNA